VFARYGLHWQQNTIRSAVAAALGLNLFHRQADKLVMCNIAQIVNVLHSVLLTGDDKCFRTPTYHAFDLLKPHRGKVAVRVENSDTDPLGLSVSCSCQAGQLVLSCVNPRHDTALNVVSDLVAVRPASATARILRSDDYNAPNTFEAPDRIVPVDHPVSIEGAKLKFALPPLSVATVMVRLA
jgi:alpha-N-arabinofuranosidase